MSIITLIIVAGALILGGYACYRIKQQKKIDIEIEQKNMNPFKYVSSYGVKIRPESSEDKARRVVRFFAKNESETYEHESANKAKGTREEILEYLKFGEFAEDLKNYVDTASDKFYMDGNR